MAKSINFMKPLKQTVVLGVGLLLVSLLSGFIGMSQYFLAVTTTNIVSALLSVYVVLLLTDYFL